MKLNVVPARTGLLWVRLGIKAFFKQPLALAGLFFMYMAVVLVISAIPVLGVLIGGMLVPAATLGLMAATAEAAKGKFPMPTVLLSAFRAGRDRAKAMLVLGAIYAGGSLLATRLAMLFAGAPGDPGNQIDTTTLLALALHAPLFLMFWHAPALVHWHGVPPLKSLFFSAVACFRNFGALALFGLAWMLVFVSVVALIGLIGGLVGGADMVRAMMMPAALLLASMSSASLYFTFRDSFVTDAPSPEGGLSADAPPSP
ncbi:BPSS1780 family membrane protein [uncultured Ramlibacter sp.]|uniref:BPSS1780 family membrane protein n=1 Tax=uncultured Ramlibacter sp. TaxID=260755 RepID=UPI00262DCD43|nr:BPSS1780 family membrane protein [uncultured Ramlibacter sp.]